MRTAPVVFLVFNRPGPTEQSFRQIAMARPERLYIVADGPRDSVSSDAGKCAAVREIVRRVDWPCDVRHNIAERNLGLRARVQSGLRWVFEQEERAIVLEDDCLPSSSFFHFCNHLLERYATDSRVMHISGTNYQGGVVRGDGSYYFSKYTNIWGWATWRRAWAHYDGEMRLWPGFKASGRLNDIAGDAFEACFWTGTFDGASSRQINTWAFQWQFSCWCQSGLAAVPNANLVENIGIGPDSTNTAWAHDSIKVKALELSSIVHPTIMLADKAADLTTFGKYFYFGGGRLLRDRNPVFRFIYRFRRRAAIGSRLRKLIGKQ